MGVRVKAGVDGGNAHRQEKTTYEDSSLDQRETTVDGYTFHWGPNEVRNFLDEGVGAAHAAFKDVDSDGVFENAIPFDTSRF